MTSVLVWSLVPLVLQLLAAESFFDLYSPEYTSSLPSKSIASIENLFSEIGNDNVANGLQNGHIGTSEASSIGGTSFRPLSDVLQNVIGGNAKAEGSGRQFLSGLDPPILANVLSSNSAEAKTCDISTVFRIRSFADVNKVRDEDELECLFTLGLSPNRPPVGMYYGHVLRVFTTEALNQSVSRFWAGKVGFKTQCRDPSTSFYMALNLLNRNLEYSALMYIGKLVANLHPSEHNDGKKSLFIDYTQDFGSLCPPPEQEQIVLESTTRAEMDLGVANPPFPLNHVIDLVRVVGKTPDGGYVMLGKTLAKKPLSLTQEGARTVAWWAVVNYDYPAFPEIPETFGPRYIDVPTRQLSE